MTIVFTTHALRRMLKYRIRSQEVRAVLKNGERIENYPNDEPLPSYLVCGSTAARVLHVVAADDAERHETIVITTYEPSSEEWQPDYKTRRIR